MAEPVLSRATVVPLVLSSSKPEYVPSLAWSTVRVLVPVAPLLSVMTPPEPLKEPMFKSLPLRSKVPPFTATGPLPRPEESPTCSVPPSTSVPAVLTLLVAITDTVCPLRAATWMPVARLVSVFPLRVA